VRRGEQRDLAADALIDELVAEVQERRPV